ncbi:MAG: hypothetical protein LBG59_06745 [Candidatus Peribacteria bacterium]|nr:hypothetical protein [Candidatus Peribacteria bacterium]
MLYAKFFDAHFLSFLHRMVYRWYTTYKSVMRYFVSMEIEELLKRERKAKAATVAFPDAPTLQ